MYFELSSLGKEFKKKNLEAGERIKNMELYTPLQKTYSKYCLEFLNIF